MTKKLVTFLLSENLLTQIDDRLKVLGGITRTDYLRSLILSDLQETKPFSLQPTGIVESESTSSEIKEIKQMINNLQKEILNLQVTTPQPQSQQSKTSKKEFKDDLNDFLKQPTTRIKKSPKKTTHKDLPKFEPKPILKKPVPKPDRSIEPSTEEPKIVAGYDVSKFNSKLITYFENLHPQQQEPYHPIFLALLEKPSIDRKELAEKIGQEVKRLTRKLKKIQEAGIIEIDEADRNNVTVHLEFDYYVPDK